MPGGSGTANWPSFDGSLASFGSGIDQRPYHRNCRCALHDKTRRDGGGGFGMPCPSNCRTVSYKIRRSWSEGSLALAAAAGSGSGVGSSPSCSSNSSPNPAVALARSMSRDELSSAGGLIQ